MCFGDYSVLKTAGPVVESAPVAPALPRIFIENENKVVVAFPSGQIAYINIDVYNTATLVERNHISADDLAGKPWYREATIPGNA